MFDDTPEALPHPLVLRDAWQSALVVEHNHTSILAVDRWVIPWLLLYRFLLIHPLLVEYRDSQFLRQ